MAEVSALTGEPLCNLCGQTTHLPVGPCDADSAAHGFVNASVAGGFASTPGNGRGALDDGYSYTFSLCEFCLDWLFRQFKLSPVITDYMYESALERLPALEAAMGRKLTPRPPTADELRWRPAHVRVREDSWRKGKKVYFDESERRTRARRG